MSDDNTQDTTAEDQPKQEPHGTDEGTQEPHGSKAQQTTQKADEGEKAPIDWKAMSRKHEDRSKALAAELADVRKQMDTSLTAAQQRVERAEIAAEVAAQKGVRLRYLTGNTREELETSADAWLEDARAVAKVGIVPTQGIGDPAPRPSSFASGADRARAQLTKTKEKA